MNKCEITFPFDGNVIFYEVLSLHDPKSLDVNSSTICPSIMHSSAAITTKGLSCPTLFLTTENGRRLPPRGTDRS